MTEPRYYRGFSLLNSYLENAVRPRTIVRQKNYL